MPLIFLSEDASDPNPWGDVPEADRNRWARYLLDYSPAFLGATMMVFQARALAEGSTHVHPTWSGYARAMHAAGFTPDRAYLLLQALRLIEHRGGITDAMRDRLLQPRERIDGHLPRPEAWVEWPRLVDAGMSPARATEHVLHDGDAPPRGRVSGGGDEIAVAD